MTDKKTFTGYPDEIAIKIIDFVRDRNDFEIIDVIVEVIDNTNS